jgi:hypothetical protein
MSSTTQPLYNYSAISLGESTEVNASLAFTFDGNQSFSVGVWFLPLSMAQQECIVYTTPSGFSINSNQGVIYLNWGGSNTQLSFEDAVLTVGQWQYLLITFSSNGTGVGRASAYINGALCGQLSNVSPGTPVTCNTLSVGSGLYMQCMFVGLWKTCLTADLATTPWQLSGAEDNLVLSANLDLSPPQDESGNSNALSVTEGAEFVTTCPALYLNIDGYATPSVADASAITVGNGSAPFSLGCWVYAGTPSIFDGVDFTIVANGDIMLPGAFLAYLQYDAQSSTYAWCAQLGGVTGTGVSSTTTFAPETWHYVAMTFDGTTVTLYVDGTACGTAAPPSITSIAQPSVMFGATPDSSSPGEFSNPFNGYIQALGIWSLALSTSQIQSLMTSPPADDTSTSCVAYYDFQTAWADNDITGNPAALFNSAQVTFQTSQSAETTGGLGKVPSTRGRVPHPVRQLAESMGIDGSVEVDSLSFCPGKGTQTALTKQQIDDILVSFNRLVGALVPEPLRDTYRDEGRRNLFMGLGVAAKIDGPLPGMVRHSIEGDQVVFQHYTVDGLLECGRFPTAEVSETAAWVIAIISTSISCLFTVLGVGFAANNLVKVLARWIQSVAGGVAQQGLLATIASTPITGALVIKIVRTLAGSGMLTSAVAAAIAGTSWWSSAFTILSIVMQIAAIWLTGGLFLAFMLTQLLVNIAQLIYVIVCDKPTNSGPIAVLSGLNPGSCAAGAGPLSLTIYGNYFMQGATATFNGVSLTTASIQNLTQMGVTVPSAQLATAGQYQVVVSNPSSSSSSNFLLFTVS